MAGAALILQMLERFPLLIWAGAALLGWIAGEIMATDPAITTRLSPATAHNLWIAAAILGAVFVVVIGLLRRRMRRSANASDQI